MFRFVLSVTPAFADTIAHALAEPGVIQPRLPGALAQVEPVDIGHIGVLMRDTFTARRLRWGGDILPAPGAYGSWDLVCAHEMLPRRRRWL